MFNKSCEPRIYRGFNVTNNGTKRLAKWRRGEILTGEWVYGYFVYSRVSNKAFIIEDFKYKPKEEIIYSKYDELAIQQPNDTNFTSAVFIGNFGTLWYEIVPDTIGQYVGFTDLYNEMIFEGDVVRDLRNQKLITVSYSCWTNSFNISYAEHYRHIEIVANENEELRR